MNRKDIMEYSCIVPCFNSEQSLPQLIEKLDAFFCEEGISQYEIILVNDSSKDETLEVIQEIARTHSNVTGVDLAKNAGQHNALLAGMSLSKGEYVISIDDDLQTEPEEIRKLIAGLSQGYDVVYGKYAQMKQSRFRNLGAEFNDFTIRKLVGKPKGLKASSFWIAKRFVIDEIVKGKSSFTNLQGLFLRTTSHVGNVLVEHKKRAYGSSNYTLKKLIRLWSSCLNYSYLPVHAVMATGVVLGFAGFLGLLTSFIVFLVNHSDLRFLILLFLILFLFGVLFTALGLIGEYVIRVMMVVTKEPQYSIREIYRAKDAKEDKE